MSLPFASFVPVAASLSAVLNVVMTAFALAILAIFSSPLIPLMSSSSSVVRDLDFGAKNARICPTMARIAPTNMPGGPPAVERAPIIVATDAQMSMTAAEPLIASPFLNAAMAFSVPVVMPGSAFAIASWRFANNAASAASAFFPAASA